MARDLTLAARQPKDVDGGFGRIPQNGSRYLASKVGLSLGFTIAT